MSGAHKKHHHPHHDGIKEASMAVSETASLPKVTFSTFILSLASSVLVQLGEVPNPDNGRMEENLLMAKHTIDVLSMLREKTQSSLDMEENRLLEGILYEVRMKYVIKTR